MTQAQLRNYLQTIISNFVPDAEQKRHIEYVIIVEDIR
jgi:hypothetical protein